VVLHEGVVTTPRDLDQGGRRSVAGDCPRGVLSRSAVPKQRADSDMRLAGGFAELTGFRVCSGGLMAPENGSGANPITQLLQVSSLAGANHTKFRLALYFRRSCGTPRRCDRVAQSPSGRNAWTLNASTASSGEGCKC
jgi:hypothetical protein